MIRHVVTIESNAELPPEVSINTTTSLVGHLLVSESIDESWQVGIQFVDDAFMQAAHREFMGIDEPTDIMTFPYADGDDIWGESEPGGDLMISVDRAQVNAVDSEWKLTDELFFLIAHGLLHLVGWDDHSDHDREAMLARQHELLKSWVDRP